MQDRNLRADMDRQEQLEQLLSEERLKVGFWTRPLIQLFSRSHPPTHVFMSYHVFSSIVQHHLLV